METVLIDLFIVPAESKAAFLEASLISQKFVKTLAGFVEGYVYEQSDGDASAPYNVVTVAVWETPQAFEAAKKAVASEYQRLGFNPQATVKGLNVTMARAIYERSPY